MTSSINRQRDYSTNLNPTPASNEGLSLHACSSSTPQYQPRYSSIQLLRQSVTSYESHDSLDRICKMPSDEAIREVYSVVLAHQLSSRSAHSSAYSSAYSTAYSSAPSTPPASILNKKLPETPQFVYRTNKRPAKKRSPSKDDKKSVWNKIKSSLA